jgi:hypothetical protein
VLLVNRKFQILKSYIDAFRQDDHESLWEVREKSYNRPWLVRWEPEAERALLASSFKTCTKLWERKNLGGSFFFFPLVLGSQLRSYTLSHTN